MATETDSESRVEAIRRFNRSYTKTIGVLHEGLLQSPFSLTEARVLFELAHREAPTATVLIEELGLDAGYLSRILRDFETRGLLNRQLSNEDRRQSFLSLTKQGREAFKRLDTRSRDEVRALVARLAVADQGRLIGAMGTIESLLGDRSEPAIPYLLRPHRPGDMGWIVYRHGVLYAQEYGWDERFEALVAEIVAKFVQHYDPKLERCWIVERDGQNVGSVLLVKKSRTVAKLRLLLVEPSAPGWGSAVGWSMSARRLRVRWDTGRSSSGRTTSSTPPGRSTPRPAIAVCARNRIRAGAMIWSGKRGS